jgi:chaperonin GroEL
VNVIDAPVFGVNRKEIFDDLALLTGATLINEDLGDDLDLIQPDMLGTCLKSITSYEETILQVDGMTDDVADIVEGIKEALQKKNSSNEVIKLEKRLARLTAKLAVVKVGANSEIELKEKADRIEDAICATKAAIKEGIIPGGGIALLDASYNIVPASIGEEILLSAIKAPYNTILENAGIESLESLKVPGTIGYGINVITGEVVNMIEAGIVDPLLVTKSALKNAASVAVTILSTDCVINNLRA